MIDDGEIERRARARYECEREYIGGGLSHAARSLPGWDEIPESWRCHYRNTERRRAAWADPPQEPHRD